MDFAMTGKSAADSSHRHTSQQLVGAGFQDNRVVWVPVCTSADITNNDSAGILTEFDQLCFDGLFLGNMDIGSYSIF